jgi:hypothetical protein
MLGAFLAWTLLPWRERAPWSWRGAGHFHRSPRGRLFGDMTVRENLEMGAYQVRAWKSRADTLEQVYRIFPRLKERSRQNSKHPERRGKADGGYRKRVDVEAKTVHV